jgi:dUTP pyrophosphatase
MRQLEQRIEYLERQFVDFARQYADPPELIFELLSYKATLPTRAHPTDSGLDLYAAEQTTLMPMQRALVPTGLRVKLPVGYEAQIRPKSGLAIRHGLTVLNTPGTIDQHYRGELKVILYNANLYDAITIVQGQPIAQLVVSRVAYPVPVSGHVLIDTDRGEGGFGSTMPKMCAHADALKDNHEF